MLACETCMYKWDPDACRYCQAEEREAQRLGIRPEPYDVMRDRRIDETLSGLRVLPMDGTLERPVREASLEES